MKVLKNYIKVIFCFIALAICSMMFVIPANLVTFALDASAYTLGNSYAVKMNAVKMPKTVDFSNSDAEFKIPLLSSVLGGVSNYIVRVIDPTGTSHDYNVNGTNVEGFFAKDIDNNNIVVNVRNSGTYKVIYIVTESGNTYYSNPYVVTVSNVSYKLDFTVQSGENAGLNQLLKTEVATGSDPIKLPVAYAKVVGNEESAGTIVSNISVTKNGAPQTLDAENSVFVTINGEKYINPTESGIYTVVYTYTAGENRPTAEFKIKVTDNFVQPSSLSVSTSNITIPSIELGSKDIILPKLTVNSNLSDDIEYNTTKIRIQKRGSEIYQELTNNDYTFDMTVEAFTGAETYYDLEGSYDITYTVVDAYGNQLEKTLNATKAYTVAGVSSTPKVYAAYDYTADTAADDIDKTAATRIKSSYGYAEVSIPAIYAEDQIAQTSDLFTFRYMQRNGTTYYVDNVRYDETAKTLVAVNSGETGYNYAAEVQDVTNENAVAKAKASSRLTIPFQFSETVDDSTASFAGTYSVYYHAVSKTYSERSTLNKSTADYTIKVEDMAASAVTSTPKIEISNLVNGYVLADNTEKLQVKISATDEKDTDKRLNNVVFYTTSAIADKADFAEKIEEAIVEAMNDSDFFYSTNIFANSIFKSKLQAKFGSNITYTLANETETKNVYELDFSSTDITNATIVAVTLNDSGNVAVDTRTISINDTNEINCPTVTVNVNYVKVENPTDANIANYYEFDGTNYTLTADTSVNGNKTYYVVGDLINGAKVYEMADFEVSHGAINLPTVVFDDADTDLQILTSYYVLKDGHDVSTTPEYKDLSSKVIINNTVNGTIVPDATGTYYVTYTAIDDSGNMSVVFFTFEVESTSKPTITINASSASEISQTGNTISAEVGSTIDFDVVLRDAEGNNVTTLTNVKLKSIETAEEGLSWAPSGTRKNSYTFNSVGTYKITFEGEYNTVSAEDKVIYVNITKTTLAWSSDFDVKKYAKTNEDVYLPDVATNVASNVKVTVKAPGGKDVDVEKIVSEDGIQLWKFTTNETTKGTYVVTYTATGNDQTLTKTINIKVGDNVPPVITYSHKADLEQDIVYKDDISYNFEVNKSTKSFVITAKSNGKTIYSYDLGLTISDKDDSGSYTNVNMSWTNLSYELKGDKVESNGNGSYTITGTGACTIKLTMKDSYDNETVETISFNVVSETKTVEKNDAVVGAVLIVISLVVLAGVILFFTFTGKKGGTKKSKKANRSEAKSNSKKESSKEVKEVEQTEVAESSEQTAPESSDDAKTGEVE